MTFRIMQCVVVDCSFCDDGWGDDDDGGPLHFETVEGARDYVLTHGWTVRDNAMCCPSCKTKFVCKVEGHDVDDDGWRSHATQNGIPYRVRDCDRCGTSEYDPPFNDLIRLDDEAGAAVVAAAEQLLVQSDGERPRE